MSSLRRNEEYRWRDLNLFWNVRWPEHFDEENKEVSTSDGFYARRGQSNPLDGMS
jgi:hypothetical protein